MVSSIFLIWGFGENCSARRTRRGARSRTVFLFVLIFSLLFGVAISPFYVRSRGRVLVMTDSGVRFVSRRGGRDGGALPSFRRFQSRSMLSLFRTM